MVRVISVAGLGFGDEGKGATVDWLCRNITSKAQIMVIRYNGGPQCSHAVVTPEGLVHLHHQLGSGTLAGAATYLDSGMIVDPITLAQELDTLSVKTGREVAYSLFVHPECPITTMFQRTYNHAASNGRHNTCGFGVGITRELYLESPDNSLTIEDLFTSKPKQLFRKVNWLRDTLLYRAYERSLNATMLRDVDVNDVVQRLCLAAEKIFKHNSPQWQVPTAPDVYIYEGAQGFLLDQEYGIQPHTTWSDLSSYAAVKSMKYHNLYRVAQLDMWGVIRSYATRHGDGVFPTEHSNDEHSPMDICNPSNQYQGNFRCGRFDLPLFLYSLKHYQNAEQLTGLVINHMDQYPRNEQVVTGYNYRDHTNLLVTACQYGGGVPCAHPTRYNSESIGKYLEHCLEHPLDYKVRRVEDSAFPQYIADVSRKPVILTGHGPTHADKEVCNIVPVSVPVSLQKEKV